MSPPGPSSRLSDRVLTDRNVTIAVATLVAIPAALGFSLAFHASAGSFLLLLTIGVGVPTAYDQHWPAYERTSHAVAWVLVASAVAILEFTALSLLGTEVLRISSTLASVGAFLVTEVGWLLVLANWSRQ